jgi:predicted ATPase
MAQNQNTNKEYEGFQMISLELFSHPVLGSISYNFTEKESNTFDSYFTVVIGPNGTGKSILLRTIIEIIRQIENQENDMIQFSLRYGFILNYKQRGEIFEYGHFAVPETGNKRAWFTSAKNISTNQPLSKPFPIPDIYLAQSQLITDKFPFQKKSDITKSGYRYLGIRSEPQIASTQRYIRRSIEFIAQEKDRVHFLKGLKHLLSEFIGDYIEPYIVYYTKNTKKFFHPNVTPEDIDEHFTAMEERFKKSEKRPPNALRYYHELRSSKTDVFQQICNFCIQRSDDQRHDTIKRSPSKGISYNILAPNEIGQFQNEFPVLEWMRQLEIVYTPEFEFKPARYSGVRDANVRYSFIESSSGEVHLITSFIGLLATLKPNSLVVIDEPEISLHPNWQMRFIYFLTTLLSGDEYKGCHFIIATHSHFLISDLAGSNSKIIGLKRDKEGTLTIVDLPVRLNTYGWSAEEVLLEVFGVPTTRNLFIYEKVGEILEMIAQRDTEQSLVPKQNFKSEIEKKIKHLQDKGIDNLSKEDPLSDVIEKIISKYGRPQ